MKRWAVILITLCLIIAAIPVQATGQLPFDDVGEDQWFYDEVCFSYENNLMNGVSSTRFEPNNPLTRGMFVTILGRMDGVDSDAYSGSTFIDVETGSWYSPYIQWASEKGIVTGYGNGKFGPNDYVNREQMATMIARYLTAKGLTLSDSENAVDGFQDAAEVSDWSKDGLELMRRTGIINGDAGNFRPKDSATRAEAATIFMRLQLAIQSIPTERVMLDAENSIYALTQRHIRFDETESIPYVDNILLAYLKKGLSDEDKEKIAQSVQGRIVAELTGPIPVLQIEVAANDLSGLSELAEKLETNTGVLYASYDVPFLNNKVETNEGFGTVTGKPGIYWNDLWYEFVGADIVRANYSHMIEPVTVGVIDRGVQSDHTELAGKVTFGSDIHEQYNQDCYQAEDSAKKLKHGTHVSGLIAASDDGSGITGIAPDSTIAFASWAADGKEAMGPIPEDDGLDWTSIVQTEYALNCVVQKGARIINCSFGFHFDEKEKSTAEKYSQRIAAATCTLLENGHDILIVQSAGNGVDNKNEAGSDVLKTSLWAGITPAVFENIADNFTVTYEQLDKHILIVAGIENQMQDGSYCLCMRQSYGETVDICAPSVGVNSTICPNDYGEMTGTSMAAPIVSGTAALVWGADPELSAPQVRQILLDTWQYQAAGKDDNGSYIYPVVNAQHAVQYTLQSKGFSAYLDYIRENYQSRSDTVRFSRNLLDENAMPEVYVMDHQAFAHFVLSYDYKLNQVNEYPFRAGGFFQFVPEKNVFCVTIPSAPYVYQPICEIQNNQVVQITDATYDMITDSYTWDGEEISHDKYLFLMNLYFPADSTVTIGGEGNDNGLSYEEVMQSQG